MYDVRFHLAMQSTLRLGLSGARHTTESKAQCFLLILYTSEWAGDRDGLSLSVIMFHLGMSACRGEGMYDMFAGESRSIEKAG